jgi:hypothetical protein
MIYQNFEGSFAAPIRVVVYTNKASITAPVVHTGAETHRWDNGSCSGDARGVYDAGTDTHFVIMIHYSYGGAIAGDGYCIGAGRDDPAAVWAWSIVPWNGQSGDGARPALTSTEFQAHGVGNLLRCTKASLIFGVPSCVWQSTAPLSNVVPVRTEYANWPIGYWVGIDGSTPGVQQLSVGYTDGTPIQPVYTGALTPSAFTVSAPGETQNWYGYVLGDAFYDTQRDTLWIEFHGPCFYSGAHACVGAAQIKLYPYPLLVRWYDFDYAEADGFLGSMSVDHAGYAMFTWVYTSPSVSTSMAVGGINPFTGAIGGRVLHWGEGGTGYHRPDYTGVGCIPGTNQCIAHGLHNALYWTPSGNCPGGVCPVYHFVSDLDLFNHCCDPNTGTCPTNGCP